jgi:hypothetical protein
MGRWSLPLASGAAILVLLATPGLLVPPEAPSTAGFSVLGALQCNPVATRTPSSLLDRLPAPNGTLPAGGHLLSTFEFAVVNYTSVDRGVVVYFPSTTTTLPLAGGHSVAVFLTPRHSTVTRAGWSSAGFGTARRNVSSPLTFATNGTAVLTNQKLSVMATAPYGALTIEVRWRWSLEVPNGTAVNGTWSVPTRAQDWPVYTPSIFYPAPYASRLAPPPRSAAIGTSFSVSLGGLVGNRTFFLEMEYPNNGTVVQSASSTAPANATNWTVGIPVVSYIGSLAPGPFLVHIHDLCGAMLYSLSVRAFFADPATVSLSLTPASCGGITLNGTTYANGSAASFAPSTAAYPFSLPYCPGHAFASWRTLGALHIASARTLLVSGNGSFAVTYS